MTREEIRELAAFQADPKIGAYALSFYFQPNPPQDRSHRGEAILAKDVVRQALKEANGRSKNGSLRGDLERVLEIASRLPGQTRGRAIFACSAQNLWKEFDLPPEGRKEKFLEMLNEYIAKLGGIPKVAKYISDRAGRLERLCSVVPETPRLDRLLRYEASLERSLDRTLSQLERLQRMRLGQPVLPKLEVRHSVS